MREKWNTLEPLDQIYFFPGLWGKSGTPTGALWVTNPPFSGACEGKVEHPRTLGTNIYLFPALWGKSGTVLNQKGLKYPIFLGLWGKSGTAPGLIYYFFLGTVREKWNTLWSSINIIFWSLWGKSGTTSVAQYIHFLEPVREKWNSPWGPIHIIFWACEGKVEQSRGHIYIILLFPWLEMFSLIMTFLYHHQLTWMFLQTLSFMDNRHYILKNLWMGFH